MSEGDEASTRGTLSPSPYRAPGSAGVASVTAARDAALWRPRSVRSQRLRAVGVLAAVVAALVLGMQLGATGLSLWVLAVVVYVPVVLWWLLRRRRFVRGVREVDDATLLLNSGRVAEAAAGYEAVASACRGEPFLHSVATFNRGVAHLRAGETTEALALFDTIERGGWFSVNAHVRANYEPLLHTGFAMGLALLGRFDEATKRVARAQSMLTPARRGMLLLVDALLLAKQGRLEECARLVAERKSDGEGLLAPTQLRSLSLLRAYALAGTGGAAAELARCLDEARAGRADEHRYLAHNWPELRAFLVAHGLAGAER